MPSTFPVKTIAGQTATGSQLSAPLKYTGSLDSYAQFDVTAVIGREFPQLQLSDILQDDEKIRDLAVLGRCLPHPLSQASKRNIQLTGGIFISLPAWRRLLPQPEPHHRRAEAPRTAAWRTDGQARVLQAAPACSVQQQARHLGRREREARR